MPNWSSDEQRIMKELAHTILKDGSADNRKTALLDIRHYPDARVLELLQHVSEKDRNREVRDLAKNLHTKMRLQAEDNPEQFAPPPRRAPGAWVCAYCGSENSKENTTCTACGAERSAAADGPPSARQAASPITADRILLLNPDNRRFLNGAKGGKVHGGMPVLLMFIFALVIGAAAIGIINYSVQQINWWNRIENNGVSAGAVIESRSATSNASFSGNDDEDGHYVTYSFSHNGVTYRQEQSVDEVYYDWAYEGRQVEVRFLSTDPNQAHLVGAGSDPSIGLAVVGGMMGMGAILIGIMAFGTMQRRGQLARDGQVIQGEIVGITSYTDSDNDYHIKFTYLFTTPEGRIIEGSYNQMRNDLRGQRLPKRGAAVAVFYANPANFRLL